MCVCGWVSEGVSEGGVGSAGRDGGTEAGGREMEGGRERERESEGSEGVSEVSQRVSEWVSE